MNKQTKNRYIRQTILPEVGESGQHKLKAARVLVIGAGGLGSPVLMYLAAAGVGTIGIVDGDHVELTNLHRQTLYTMSDIGNAKSEVAKLKLGELNPHINIITHNLLLTAENALHIIEQYDYIVDGSDNFATRYLVNDVCVYLNKALVSASILRWEGQCSVFAGSNGPCYRCLFPEPPSDALNCSQAGVIGSLAGTMGSIQATEVIKLILQQGEGLIGKMLTLNALSMEFQHLTLTKDPHCKVCSQAKKFPTFPEDYVMNCVNNTEISIEGFKNLQVSGEDFQLVDVRNDDEYAAGNLGGKLIPLPQLPTRLDELDKNKLIIIHCQHGVRGGRAVEFLQSKGFTNLKNLTGGYAKWLEGR